MLTHIVCFKYKADVAESLREDHRQRLAGLLVFISDVKALGLKTAQGLLLSEAYYWDQNDETRAFAKRYGEAFNGKLPNFIQMSNYSAALPQPERPTSAPLQPTPATAPPTSRPEQLRMHRASSRPCATPRRRRASSC